MAGPASTPSIFKVHSECKEEVWIPGGLTETGLCQPAPSISSGFPLAHPDPFHTRTRTPAGSRKGKARVCSVQLCTGAPCYPGSAPPHPGPEASAQRGAVALPAKGAGLGVQAALPQCCCCWQSTSPGCWESLCWSCWLGRRCGHGWETQTTTGPAAAGWQKDAAEAETPGSWVSLRWSPAVCSSASELGGRPHWGRGDGGIHLGLGWGWESSTFLVRETTGKTSGDGVMFPGEIRTFPRLPYA